MRRCAVIGSPVAHSRSPRLHAAAYRHLGLDWVYGRHEVTAQTLGEFVAGLDASWRGLSCTMPLKSAITALGRPDDIVAALGVANTVVFDGAPGDVTATRVCNTDVTGFIGALGATATVGTVPWRRQFPVVVGTGATATSAVYALGRLGVTAVQVAGRNAAALAALRQQAAAWGVAVTPRALDGAWEPAGLAISTVPAAVAAGLAAQISAADLVFDVLYDPWPTPLLAAAQAHGRATLSGLDLLVHQAVGQVELMTGRAVPADVLYQAL